jgi:hypothetical protein
VSRPRPAIRPQIEWRWLAERSLLAFVVVFAIVAMAKSVGHDYAADFRGGMWHAGQAALAGRSPYVAADAHRLLVLRHPYIPPPPLAIIAIPLSVLPFWIAASLWSVLCVAAFCGALRLLGVRDPRVYVLALCSFPFIESLQVGGPEPLLALGAAAAWRYRDSSRGAIAAGLLIAAKLLAWPLLIWFLVTRRIRSAAIAAVCAVVTLLASWACLGFKGLLDYPKLVAADARAFERMSHSLVSAAMRAGVSEHLARELALGVALAVALAALRAARGSDRGWFVAALTLGLLSSPLMWIHYLVLLFVPLAIARGRLSAAWALTAAFWLLPFEPPPTEVEVLLVLAIAVAIVLLSSKHQQREAPGRLEHRLVTA